MKATDKELATLLCKINQLKHLNVQGTLFGPLSFQAIVMDRIDLPGAEGTSTRSGRSPPYERRLCDLVEVLDLKLCGAVTGDMIQTILASCPSLTHFHADKITITEITQGGDWVCFGLRELDIYLEADVQVSHYHDEDAFASGSFAELHRDVFGRLATLTRLERLILTDDIDSYRGKRTLDLRLDGGMDLLAGLKNMRELHFRCDGHQSMGVAEARWIAQHWPGLRVLGGLVTQNKIILEEMRSILARQKIHLQSINSNVID
ncbi:hypothetical protein BGX31_006690 [Mortierella sp. GBA43]|nr:hypothetical protein BGX31_006690 [Mortierella sp. GBA43]